MPTYNA
jgi:hypothetical protein